MNLDELLVAARAEDPRLAHGSASRAFWAAVSRELSNFLRGHDRKDAEEIVQATFLVICSKLHDYKQTGPDSFVRWIRTIASNKSREHRRAHNLGPIHDAKLQADAERTPPTSPSAWVLKREQAQLVDTQLAELPLEQRDAIIHKLDDEPDDALARRESVPVQTVWTRRHSGMKKLVTGLEARRRTPQR